MLVQGLVVPVLRNVETMNYADIEKTTAQLGEKVRTIGHCSDITACSVPSPPPPLPPCRLGRALWL